MRPFPTRAGRGRTGALFLLHLEDPARVLDTFSGSPNPGGSCGFLGVTKAARQLGISRFSIQDWRRQARLHAAGKLASNPVVGSDEPVADERDRRIVEVWRAHPGLGPSQVRNQLRRAGMKVSVHTVRKVLELASGPPGLAETTGGA